MQGNTSGIECSDSCGSCHDTILVRTRTDVVQERSLPCPCLPCEEDITARMCYELLYELLSLHLSTPC